MTREEAITILEEISLIDDSIYQYNTKYLEALDMAIQALEQTDGDLISRQAVLDIFGDIHPLDYNARAYVTQIKELSSAEKTDGDLISEIDKLPRIKVGNSNSPTVKYCIDEVLLYDLLEHYEGNNVKTDGDLISRKDVINMFNTMDRYKADKLILQDTDKKFPGNEVFIVDDCYELLEQLLTYSAEQKIGYWISLDDFRGKYNENGFMCSECGEHIDFKENFCPNCGRRMERVE